MLILILAGLTLKAHRARSFSKFAPAMFAIGLAFSLGLAILCWYNWARFGSLLETGISYQLAGAYLQKDFRELFSPAYIVQNLYNYFLNPPKIGYPFPYFSPNRGVSRSVVPFISIPKNYYTQDSTGLFYSSPFVLLAIVSIVNLFSERSQNWSKGYCPKFNWLTISLCGSFFSALSVFAAFFWTAERYIVDFIPGLVLLSVIGFWQTDQYLTQKTLLRSLHRTVGICLIAITVIVSGLLALSINAAGFRALNPLLWRQLSNLFRN